ncbi:MAG TPA: hypothetical protein VFV75_13670 [Candidatus Polarisedimenticolaceae bacterium]|nr:hypothetical protein [Candidatus Polarisedimenticolaceae bacterium]
MKHLAAATLLTCFASSAHALDGAWTASRDEMDADRIYVQMTRGRTHNMGTTMSLRAFTGLSPDALQAATATPVRFELRRDAGDTTFEGSFREGKGAGQFSFAPRPAFLETVRALGIETGKPGRGKSRDEEEQLFGLALCDVTVAYIKSMIAEGYRLTLEDYQSMRIFDVTPQYIREMRDLGFHNVSHDELVATKIHGVTPSYIRQMRKSGWDLSLDDYQANRIHGVTPQFIAEMRELGYRDLSADDLLSFRIHGVTREFIRELRELGYDDVEADDLIAARIHGVTPSFIREVEEAGYHKVPFDKLISLRISGIDARTLERMRVY